MQIETSSLPLRTPVIAACIGLLSALALAALPMSAAAQAQTIEGRQFEGQARVANAELALNGVGLRGVAWIKGYVAGLYLTHKATTAAEAVVAPGPKRLQMVMLMEVSAADFIHAFQVGMHGNTTATERAALEKRMRQFEGLIEGVGKVTRGDVVDLDFLPGRGLLFSVNGKPRGEAIPGADLYEALLRIFLGDKPVDSKLKAGLLGAPAP